MDRTATPGSGEGIVIWFDPRAGCGFIKPADGGHDLFVRSSEEGSRFVMGQRVEYILVTYDKQNRKAAFIRAILDADARTVGPLASSLHSAR
jgi:cold shock CspA family protein